MREPVRVSDRDGFDGLAAFAPDGLTLSWTSNATPAGTSQLFIADWDHEAALALLAEQPRRASAGPALPASDPAIRTADLRAHVEALTAEVMEGRLTGTEGERLATDYVARAFAAIGLEPAGDDGFFQSFDFTAGVSLSEDNALTISVDGQAEQLALGETWTPLAFAKTGTAAPAGVVFAGYGIVAPAEGGFDAIDSYGDIDVTDAWVLMWRGLPADLTPEHRTALRPFSDLRYRASVALSRGAAGVIVAPPPRPGFDDVLPRLSYEATSGAATLPVVAVDRAAGMRMLSILLDIDEVMASVEAGMAAPRMLIGVEAEARIGLDFETRTGRNVLGRLSLGDGTAPALAIGAHVDHLGRGETSGSLARGDERGQIHPGADDNASGVAALIEVAEYLADLKTRGRLEGPRDIVFAAWSGEELGLLGASHYVDALQEDLGADGLADALTAYLNMDMVGRLETQLVAGGTGSSPIWAREIERRNAVVGLPIVTNDDPYMPTDATEFYLAGVPILSLFTGAHEDYHRPGDTPDKLNYDGLKEIARFVALIARSRAQSDEEPAYVERARPAGESGGRMAGVFLGTIPDYATEGEVGVPLSGVVKGGPAEEAGLSGGDVLVGLAGHDLANIYDFVRVLNGLRPGETIEAVVERDGGRVTLDVTPRVRE
ncbi:MAG: M20/M25/M40 family metallo-hydrolase [Pseudomonadota bacterium]